MMRGGWSDDHDDDNDGDDGDDGGGAHDDEGEEYPGDNHNQ